MYCGACRGVNAARGVFRESGSEGVLGWIVKKWSGHIDRAIGLRRYCGACRVVNAAREARWKWRVRMLEGGGKGSLLSPLPAETAAGSYKHADAA